MPLLRFAIPLLLCAMLAFGQHPQANRVLILVNDSMPKENGTGSTGASVFVGEYYAAKRGIPKTNILHLKTSTGEVISYEDYQSQVEKPVKAFLEAGDGAMKTQILYIVPTYGVPLKTTAPGGQVSVDSALSAMYSAPKFNLRTINPYASPQGSRPAKFAPWSAQRDAVGNWKMFLVSRLDGPGALIAKGLVDKAITAETELTMSSGKAYFDYQGTRGPTEWQYSVDEEVRNAAALSKAKGFNTVLNTQRDSWCRSMLPPAPVYYYDSAAKNIAIISTGAEAFASFSLKPLQEGDVTVKLKGEVINNIGNLEYITLSTADPKTYIKLTYPFVPFHDWESNDKMILEKVVNGATVAKAELAVNNTMGNVVNDLSELSVSFRNTAISVKRNGVVIAQGADSTNAALDVTKVSVGTRCWQHRLTGLAVTDRSGTAVWNDTFNTDTTKNYTWESAPPSGSNALWVWGWYGGASDVYRFVNGAVGAQLTSYTALTIRNPADPNPAVAGILERRWAGNWVPRMLEEGVTATWGAVDEPYATFYAPGGNVFDHLWSGYNFGESFYIAQNTLNWVMVAVGDPLYAPKIFQTTAESPMRILNGVVNAASNDVGPLAPGEIVALYGEGLGPATLAQAKVNAEGALETEIDGTRVYFDDVAAPLIYASAKQVAAIVPYESGKRGYTEVAVEAGGFRSNPVVVNMERSAPGIFTQNATGFGFGAILNQDSLLNTIARPASKGSIVVMYATGEGPTTPEGINGKIASAVMPKPGLPVSVQVGGVDAEILYAGAAPGQVAGVFQVNARVPENAPSGLVPVFLKIGGRDSRSGVVLAVR